MRYVTLGSTSHHARMIEAAVLDPGYLLPDSFNVINGFANDLDRI